MNRRISWHALDTMRERSIPESVVDAALDAPDQIVECDDGRRAYQSVFRVYDKKFLVRVIVNDSRDPVEVVTVYKTTKIEKYWKPNESVGDHEEASDETKGRDE